MKDDRIRARVRCYAGARADQAPRAFAVGGYEARVRHILREWVEEDRAGGPESRRRVFDVLCEDGRTFRLVHRLADDAWFAAPDPDLLKGV